jgi:hypothetical protein
MIEVFIMKPDEPPASDVIASLYLNLKAQGRMDDIFYSAPYDINTFMAWAKGVSIFYGVFKDNVVVGCGWVDVPVVMECESGRYRKAEIGFGFCNQCSVFQALQAGREMIEMTFDLYQIDYLFGTTPSPNKAALAYAKRLGFQLFGPIPNSCSFRGKLESTYISHISKDLLNGRSIKEED